MTHPTTPPPPPGPRHLGSYGHRAEPLTDHQRRDNYRRQNGTLAGGRLTPRQRRRAEHKANVAARRAA